MYHFNSRLNLKPVRYPFLYGPDSASSVSYASPWWTSGSRSPFKNSATSSQNQLPLCGSHSTLFMPEEHLAWWHLVSWVWAGHFHLLNLLAQRNCIRDIPGSPAPCTVWAHSRWFDACCVGKHLVLLPDLSLSTHGQTYLPPFYTSVT